MRANMAHRSLAEVARMVFLVARSCGVIPKAEMMRCIFSMFSGLAK